MELNIKAVIVISVALLLITMPLLSLYPNANDGLKVIVTFPYLYEDVKNLLCEGDEVFVLTPPGADPHTYQLKPSDIDLLGQASLIISTAHAPFEKTLHDLVSSGKIKASIVELPTIAQVVLRIPGTNATNYHALQLYPQNYIAFINAVADELSKLRPDCASIYRSNADKLIHQLASINASTRKFYGWIAVISDPSIQYIATWLGFDVKYVLVKEHDTPITPEDYRMAENTVKTYTNVAVIVSESNPAKDKLHEIAERYGVLYIELPSILTYNGSLRYINDVAHIVSNVAVTSTTRTTQGSSANIALSIFAVAMVVIIILIYVWLKRR
ncbi:MAG: metal ABC transporter substrate-binding protein [Ignisphaera sp.]|nr:metal ABC transporter substrate-binding protein [Ignisphaera sp.]